MNHQYAPSLSPISDTTDSPTRATAGSPWTTDINHMTVNSVASVASWLSSQTGSQKYRVYQDYQRKMDSYDGNIVRFLGSALPSLLLLAPVAIAYRSMRRMSQVLN